MNKSTVLKISIATGVLIVLLTIVYNHWSGSTEPSKSTLNSSFNSGPASKITDTLELDREKLSLNALTPTSSQNANKFLALSKELSSHINPGCVTRKLSSYRTSRSETVYHHPPIVHYVKLSTSGTAQLSLRDYLAMMSAYKFLRPEKIYIHSNVQVGGKYFDLAQQWSGTTITVNKVERKTTLSGKGVSFIQISADYVKVSQVLKYGGLVSDFDVIIINGTRLIEEQRNSECVIAEEGTIPNLGLVSCIKNSSFMQQWLDHYHNDYDPRSWLYNSAFVPLNILTKDTSVCYNIHLDNTMCVHPNAGEAKRQWLKHDGVPHWRTKTAAHYYLRQNMLPSDDNLLHGDTSLSEMMQYVNDYQLPPN